MGWNAAKGKIRQRRWQSWIKYDTFARPHCTALHTSAKSARPFYIPQWLIPNIFLGNFNEPFEMRPNGTRGSWEVIKGLFSAIGYIIICGAFFLLHIFDENNKSTAFVTEIFLLRGRRPEKAGNKIDPMSNFLVFFKYCSETENTEVCNSHVLPVARWQFGRELNPDIN